MGPEPYEDGLRPDQLKSGMEAWAWSWDWPAGLSKPMSAQKPIRGVLAETNDRIGDTTRGPGWFAPYSGKSRRPAWTKCVRVEAVSLCSCRELAEKSYNDAVQKTIARFNGLSRLAQDSLVKSQALGFDDDGFLEEYPVMAVDMSGDRSALILAAGPNMVLKPDHEGIAMPWAEFAALVDRGDFGSRDGSADLLLDGKGCENALVDVWRAMVYIQDRFLVPFGKVADMFEGHAPQALWFPK